MRMSLEKRPPPFGSEPRPIAQPSNVVANATSALCEYYESIVHKKAETIVLPLGAGEGIVRSRSDGKRSETERYIISLSRSVSH